MNMRYISNCHDEDRSVILEYLQEWRGAKPILLLCCGELYTDKLFLLAMRRSTGNNEGTVKIGHLASCGEVRPRDRPPAHPHRLLNMLTLLRRLEGLIWTREHRLEGTYQTRQSRH